MRSCLALFSALSLVACAQSSGVQQVGPDTYQVSVHAAPARGGAAGARGIALSDANAHCMAMGKQIMTQSISSGSSSHLPGGTVEVTFQCLAAGDRGLQRPVYQRSPDAVIQHRYGY